MLTLGQQRDKAMALGMMHDLQPRAPFRKIPGAPPCCSNGWPVVVIALW